MKFDLDQYLSEYRAENAIRIEFGQAIDPANAEVGWSTQPVCLNVDDDQWAYVRIYAARTPPDGPWIDFHDIESRPIEQELWNRLESGQLVSAGFYLISVDDPIARAQLIALRLQQKNERDALKRERVEAGLLVDPATAEMAWHHADVMDPYHDGFPDLPHASEGTCVGRERFARVPGGVWVNFGDLPEATREALWQRSDSTKLKFPNGVLDPEAGWLKG
ncbi:MAG: hypothetical protein Q8M31_23550 [Beijerinckiaceae bacterium]|nr:hypothetical protein [Beijerinckiaceae bacterium]